MIFAPAGTGSLVAFVAILVFVIAAFLAAVHRGYGSVKATGFAALGLAVWLGGLSALVASGRMTSLPLGGLPFFFAPVVVIPSVLAGSRVGLRLAETVPIAALVGFQGFRLPLELVLHAWVEQGTIPETMTWTGSNWDVVSGVVALAAAPFAGRSRTIAALANTIGFLLLLNVARVALLSAPVPFGWRVDPPLQLAFHLPYAFIGPVCVGGALLGHLLLTRALVIGRSGGSFRSAREVA